MSQNPLAAFDAAIQTVTADRGAIYGHPADDFGRVAQMLPAIEGVADLRLRHTLHMILVKIARLAESPTHLDSWIDIAGYARCGVAVIDRDTPPPDLPSIVG